MAHILIIEDEPAIAMVLQEMFTDEGYEVDKAYDGLSGLRMLKELSNIDLIIVDLNMPGIGGKKVIETMRSDVLYKDIPAVIITGTAYNPSDFPPEESYQAILQKPFDLMELLKKVRELI